MGAVFRIAERMRERGRYSDGAFGWEARFEPGQDEQRLDEGFVNAPMMVGDDEQYAATMALLANRIGVPARVAVGCRAQAQRGPQGQAPGRVGGDPRRQRLVAGAAHRRLHGAPAARGATPPRCPRSRCPRSSARRTVPGARSPRSRTSRRRRTGRRRPTSRCRRWPLLLLVPLARRARAPAQGAAPASSAYRLARVAGLPRRLGRAAWTPPTTWRGGPARPPARPGGPARRAGGARARRGRRHLLPRRARHRRGVLGARGGAPAPTCGPPPAPYAACSRRWTRARCCGAAEGSLRSPGSR